MWLKILLSALIVAFCVALGYFAAEKYRARKKFFSELSSLNEAYLNELSYAKKPLEVFLEERKGKGEFAKVISSLLRHEPPSLKNFRLTEEEQADCSEYFSMLGRGDSLSQRTFFSSKTSCLAQKKTACEKEAKTRTTLYVKLGLLAGLAFVILIL